MSYGSLVGLADYEGLEGFGQASAQDIAHLMKALSAGQATERPAVAVPGDGFTLKPESLDYTLKNVTYRMEHIVAWKQWDKVPAYNTVEEYSKLLEYGNGEAAFIEEGQLPTEDDATYERQFDVVKFMGTTRRITHVMQTVRSHIGNVVTQETINGTMWLLRQVERALFIGSAALVPQEFDGLFTLIARDASATNVLDLRGAPLDQDKLEEASHIIRAAPNYGFPTDLYLSDGAYSDLARDLYPKQRILVPTSTTPGYDGYVGNEVKGIRTQAGPIKFNPDVFIEPGSAPNATGVGDPAKRPGVPTLGAATTPPEVASLFGAADVGDYRYRVAARNRFGTSAPVDLAAAVTVADGDKVTFVITPSAPVPTAYVIFRSEKDGGAGTEVEITQIPATGAPVTFNDLNLDLPNTSKAAMIQGNRENMVIKQLAPYTRIPLATIDTSTRWAQILYLVLTLHSPNKNILFKNVGRAAGTLSPSI